MARRYTREDMTARYLRDREDPNYIGSDLIAWRQECKDAYGQDARDWLSVTSTRIFAGPPLPLP